MIARLDYRRQFLQDVASEVVHATAEYPPMNSLHEGYAVILEELDELWDEIKKKPRTRNLDHLYTEAVQTAAMLVRLAEDCICSEINT